MPDRLPQEMPQPNCQSPHLWNLAPKIYNAIIAESFRSAREIRNLTRDRTSTVFVDFADAIFGVLHCSPGRVLLIEINR